MQRVTNDQSHQKVCINKKNDQIKNDNDLKLIFFKLICFVILILEQRSRSQQKDLVKENIPVQTSLPPSVEGPINAILICHIPKLRWQLKYQSLCRSAIVKVAWWGENDTSAIFK